MNGRVERLEMVIFENAARRKQLVGARGIGVIVAERRLSRDDRRGGRVRRDLRERSRAVVRPKMVSWIAVVEKILGWIEVGSAVQPWIMLMVRSRKRSIPVCVEVRVSVGSMVIHDKV